MTIIKNIFQNNVRRQYVYIAIVFVMFFILIIQRAHTGPLLEIEEYTNRVVVERDGRIHFTLIQGDYTENGARAMMREKLPSKLNTNEWVYYKFGIDISQGWPVNKNQDALIVQWRNGWGRPLFSIHLVGNKFYIKRSEKPVKKYFYKADTELVNEFLINAKWAEGGNGRLIVSIGNKDVVDYTGPTLKKTGQKPHVGFGLYRPQWNKKKFNPDNRMSIIFTHFDFGIIDSDKRQYRLTPKKH